MTTTTTTTTDTRAGFDNAAWFFYEHGGFSYDSATETPEQGRLRGARDDAAIERGGKARGWYVEWESDGDGDHSYLDQPEFDGYEITTCEMASLYDADDNHLTSLGCIDDADDNYRRLIEAQLMAEALSDMIHDAKVRDAAPTSAERRVARQTIRAIQDNDRALAWATGR